MQIVIDIPKDIYEKLKSAYYGVNDKEISISEVNETLSSIMHGTPLPKGHGRLIDADKLISSFPNYDGMSDVAKTIDYTPTIIEADKEE